MDDDLKDIKAFCEKKDKAAFDRLVVKYKDRVFNVCYRFMGNYNDANDCAQDTFIKVFKSLGGFKGDSAFPTWLYRIAVNTCKNKVSSLSYKFSRLMVRFDPPAVDVKDEAASPEAELEQSEKGAEIQKAIDALPPDHKTVVVLRDIEGLSYEEIAEITGYNIGTVKSKLSRARERLKGMLKGLV